MVDSAYIKLGVIKQVQGVKGQVLAHLSYRLSPLVNLKSLFIQLDHTLVPYQISYCQILHDQAIIRFHKVEDRNMAYALKGKALFTQQDAFPQLVVPQDPTSNLVGYQVADIKQGILGILERIDSFPWQKLLVVNYQTKELLVPYHEALLHHIDHTNKQIIVHLPPGFIAALY